MRNKFGPFPWGLGSGVLSAQLMPPTITLGTPSVSTGTPGTSVTIPGTGLGSTAGTVKLNNVSATVTNWSSISVTFTVPSQVSYPDAHPIVVTTVDGRSCPGATFTTTAPYNFKAANPTALGTGLLLNTANKALFAPTTTSFSAAAWVKFSTGGGHVIGIGQSGNVLWRVYVNPATSKARFEVWDNSGVNVSQANGANVLSDGNWHFLVGSYDQSVKVASLSVDGAAFTTGGAITNNMNGANNGFSIGNANDGSLVFAGAIDEAGFWSGRALTLADVTALYASAAGSAYTDLTAGLKTSLLAYYDLDEATGATRVDKVNGYHLSDSGAANVQQVTGLK